MNQNILAYERGMRFHLAIFSANMMRSAPEFAVTKAQANRRRKELRNAGYSVTIFAITPDGNLALD